MKEVQDIYLKRMSNGAHFIFVSEILTHAKADTLVVSKVAKLVDRLSQAVAEEDKCIKVQQKSFISDKIAQADRDRDALYASYKKAVEAFEDMPVADMAEAAKVLAQHIKEYAINPRAELHKESGMLVNFIDDLQGSLAPQVATLSLTTMVEKLHEANQRVIDADRERTNERLTTLPVGALKAARAESDDAYRMLVKAVNALALVAALEKDGADLAYAPFIDYVNQQVTQYKRTVLNQKADKPQATPGTGDDTGGIGSDTPGTGGNTGTGGDEPETPGTGGNTGTGGGSSDDEFV